MGIILQDNQVIVDAINNSSGGGGQTTLPDAYFDAFSRLRVSELTTLIDLKYLHDDQPLFVDEVNSGGSSVYSSTTSSVTIGTNSTSDYVVRQTKQRFNYQNGKSQLILTTFSGFQNQTNVNKRIGYFSSNTTAPYNSTLDGLFLQSDGSNISTNIYRSGTLVESVNQSSFNRDRLDGTGSSGITADWSKDQILVIDFQYLGVGRVRWGLDIDGVIVYFHETLNANNIEDVYMTSPNQPLRWEIRQSGVGSGTFKAICSTVASEGSINQVGRILSYNVGNNRLNANLAGTTYAALGIRLKSIQKDTNINIVDFSTLSTTNDDYLLELRFNPSVTNTFTYAGVNNSSIEIAEGSSSNVASGGTMVYSTYGRRNSDLKTQINNAIRLGSNLDGTLDEFVICITPISNGLDLYTSLNWNELI